MTFKVSYVQITQSIKVSKHPDANSISSVQFQLWGQSQSIASCTLISIWNCFNRTVVFSQLKFCTISASCSSLQVEIVNAIDGCSELSIVRIKSISDIVINSVPYSLSDNITYVMIVKTNIVLTCVISKHLR